MDSHSQYRNAAFVAAKLGFFPNGDKDNKLNQIAKWVAGKTTDKRLTITHPAPIDVPSEFISCVTFALSTSEEKGATSTGKKLSIVEIQITDSTCRNKPFRGIGIGDEKDNSMAVDALINVLLYDERTRQTFASAFFPEIDQDHMSTVESLTGYIVACGGNPPTIIAKPLEEPGKSFSHQFLIGDDVIAQGQGKTAKKAEVEAFNNLLTTIHSAFTPPGEIEACLRILGNEMAKMEILTKKNWDSLTANSSKFDDLFCVLRRALENNIMTSAAIRRLILKSLSEEDKLFKENPDDAYLLQLFLVFKLKEARSEGRLFPFRLIDTVVLSSNTVEPFSTIMLKPSTSATVLDLLGRIPPASNTARPQSTGFSTDQLYAPPSTSTAALRERAPLMVTTNTTPSSSQPESTQSQNCCKPWSCTIL